MHNIPPRPRPHGRSSPCRGLVLITGLLAVWGSILIADPAIGQQVDATTASPAPSREERVRALRQREWEVRATRVPEPILVDGELSEPSWNDAEVISEFYQRLQRDVLPASEQTEIRLLYDERSLYIGVRAFDSEPDKMAIKAIFRDEGAPGDVINILIDAYHGHRNAIQFSSNANGAMWDLMQVGETASTRDASFDVVWHAKGRRMPTGYEIEIAIPFTSLRFDSKPLGEETVFGIAFKRNIARKNEEAIWPYVSNDSDWQRPAEYGHLRGLVNVRPGRNLEIRPYVLGGATRDFTRETSDGRREAGFDVKWGMTTGLTADFSVNTDFAQEEADVQQVNFTRFSLFFPEKRQFFLEGEQAFKFGIAREADLAFTRRIGLSSGGEIVPIRAGARVSGRQGRMNLGLMNVQTGEATTLAGTLPAQNFSVLRVRRDVLARSSVGAILTNVQGEGRFNRVYGADATFYLNRVWFVDGFFAAMNESSAPTSGAGYGRFAYQSDRLGGSYELLTIGEGFSPAVGFVHRPDSRRHTGSLRFSPRPASDLIRQLHMTAALEYITNQQNVLESRERSGSFQVQFDSGHSVTLTGYNEREYITSPFRLRGSLAVPPGVYAFNNVEARYQSPMRRDSSLSVTYTTGGFWNGERDAISIRSDYRPATHFGLSGNYDVNWVDLPAGRWTSHLLSSGIMIPFRANVAILSLLQYNRDTRQLSSNVRFNWIPKPGTDLFVVYNELDTDRSAFGALNRSIAVKLNYSLAL